MWVELEQPASSGVARTRQMQRFAALLGLPHGARAGAYLTRLQRWAAACAPDGDLTGRPARSIAQAAGWRGDPETLLAALAGAGYLQRRPGGARLLGLASDGLSDASSARPRSSALVSAPSSPARLHVSGLWAAALRELAGMVNEANFAAFLQDTIGLYQSGHWITIGVPSAYVQDVLAQRFRTAIDRALYEVSGLPLRPRLILLPPLPAGPA